jgi:hypothetical protein
MMKRNRNKYVTRAPRLPQGPRPESTKIKRPTMAVLFPVKTGRIDGTANFLLLGTAGVRELSGQDFSEAETRVKADFELRAVLSLRDALNANDLAGIIRAVEQASPLLMPSLMKPEIRGQLQKQVDAETRRAIMRNVENRVNEAIARKVDHLLGEVIEDFRKKMGANIRKWPDMARSLLAKLISDRTDGARFVLWWRNEDRCFTPAIYCPDERTAVFVWALLSVVAGDKLSVCPRCGTVFLGRSDQTYCKLQCGAAVRMARSRSKHGKGRKLA